MLRMIDLCAGLGGASAAMRERGWDVLTVDVDPAFGTDIVADVCTWQYVGPRPDLIWASPPCTEFSRESMPWCRTWAEPDMLIALSCKTIIDEIQPRYWVIENVHGAAKWFLPFFGAPKRIVGPFYLWGYFPHLGAIDAQKWRKKETLSSARAAERAMIPYAFSAALARAIETQQVLLLEDEMTDEMIERLAVGAQTADDVSKLCELFPFLSTRLCPFCGNTQFGKNIYACPQCGYEYDADGSVDPFVLADMMCDGNSYHDVTMPQLLGFVFTQLLRQEREAEQRSTYSVRLEFGDGEMPDAYLCRDDVMIALLYDMPRCIGGPNNDCDSIDNWELSDNMQEMVRLLNRSA